MHSSDALDFLCLHEMAILNHDGSTCLSILVALLVCLGEC